MGISKNYQKALEICDEFQEFTIKEYIKGKSPKLLLLCNNCGHEFERYQCHFIQCPHVCPKCHPKGSNQFISLKEAQNRIDDVYEKEYLKILNYNGNNTLSKIKCLHCGLEFEAVPASLWRHRIKGCPQCEKTKSSGEAKLEKFFREHKINFVCQKRFLDCKDKLMLPFDFYLTDYNICVEFQGEQHINKNSMFWSETLELHDKIKKDYCKNNNIQLIEIPYCDINHIEKYFMFIQE